MSNPYQIFAKRFSTHFSPSSTSTGFRKDINGLRAIAVLAVLLYHFDVPGIKGGFVGVDVFFVISGFLMAGIIFRPMEAGRFSLLSFYGARIRRIVPALLVMLLVCLLLGAFVLIPSDYMELGRQAAAATVFISNTVLTTGGGYFSEELSQKWLFHTWSLGVEWQFYLLFPLLLIGLRRWQHGRWTNKILLGLFLLSLAMCIGFTPVSAKVSFYLPHTRIWELLAGALVYRYRDIRTFPHQPYIGLIILALAFLLIPESRRFPGWYPLVPVLGAMLIIHANKNVWVLCNPVAQALGNISYSLYLWHWPVVVFGAYLFGHNTVITLGGMALAGVLGTASYLLVEKPTRSIRTWHPRIILAYAASINAVGMGALLVWLGNGLPMRLPEHLREKVAVNESLVEEWLFPKSCGNYRRPVGPQGPRSCQLGLENGSTILVWGDSHGEQLYPAWQALEPEMNKHRKKVLFMTSGSCPPVRFVNHTEQRFFCDSFNESAFQRALQPDVRSVVLVAHWQSYIAAPDAMKQVSPTQMVFQTSEQALGVLKTNLTRDVRTLRGMGKSIYLLQPVPTHEGFFVREWARMLWGRAYTNLALSQVSEMQTMRNMVNEVATETGSTVLDSTAVFCTSPTTCRTDINGYALYKDSNHLSRFGAMEMLPLLREILGMADSHN